MDGRLELSDSELIDSTRGLLGKSVSLYPNNTGNVKAIDHFYRNSGIVSRMRVNNTEKVEPGNYDFAEFRGRVAPIWCWKLFVFTHAQ